MKLGVKRDCCPLRGEKIDWKKIMVEIEKELDGSGYAEKS